VRPRIATRLESLRFARNAKMIPPEQSPIAKTEPIQLDDGKRGSLEFLSRMGRLSSALPNVV
jgi:hypothetical protein